MAAPMMMMMTLIIILHLLCLLEIFVNFLI